MNADVMERLRVAVSGLLAARGDRGTVSDTEPLFTSGRLDSLAATELIVTLEQDFGMDLSGADFDISALDTLRELSAMVTRANA